MSSSFLEEASVLLDRVKGRPLHLAERKKMAVELAELMLQEASRTMTSEEKEIQEQLSRLMRDPAGKAFTMAMTDQCFRSHTNRRVADQMIYLLNQIGVPQYLDWVKRFELHFFKTLGPSVAQFLVPFATHTLRKETSRVILPGEAALLNKHLAERKKQGVQLNLNHLGEAILSESEAKHRMQIYLEDLKNPGIDYISVKISTIFSQINLIDFDGTVDTIAERLKNLYRTAIKYPVSRSDGATKAKFINLDMEEYRDLHLTVAAFKQVLNEPEFSDYSAGIVLQAYLPDSHNIQKELTEWAKKRVASGGAPIKIRIVKGANLAMEQFEASLKGWPQAPYTTKLEVDANYKRMAIYGCLKENARAVRLGVASHNLFDIAFAILLRLENEVEPYVGFEMLEGMADHIRRVVQKLTGDMLLYCPVATKAEFQHAIAYLIRRLDENTGPENFLRHAFGLKAGTDIWESQTSLFSQSCDEIEATSLAPRRTQNRLLAPQRVDFEAPFENEPDTDFSLPQNRKWAEELSKSWEKKKIEDLPIAIGGELLFENTDGVGHSPSHPGKTLFRYAKANKQHIDDALKCAKKHEKEWAKTTVAHRSHLLARAAQLMRERRGELIGAMMLEAGKTIPESDPEVSEAIDFAEYYRRQMAKMAAMKDIRWEPKGTIFVASPWNFPCSIPAGGILAALITGNCVLFKPASDTVLNGWHLVNAIWDAGVPKEVLQFIPCSGEEAGSELIKDLRVNCVILTGGTETARNFLKLRPDLDLAAETGGKNAMIITALADRDLAIKDLVQSAFGHAGQKCSAASLAILEAEVYDDPQFRKTLREAAASLKVGLPWDPATKMNPLIHEPRGVLKRGLTLLEPGEEWLLEPKQDPSNPCLWSPGIKWNVKPGSFTHMTELFGPVLAVMRAGDLRHAIELANAVPFGLTSGLQSLDEREQAYWMEEIEAGNLYINRTVTGAIVRRQPFGGTKASSFGNGSKAGGPNYLRELMKAAQHGLPQEKCPVNEWVNNLTSFLEKLDLSAEQLGLWTGSVANYAYWWKRMRQDRDPTKIVGEDNFFRYLPRKGIVLRIEPHSNPLDALRVSAAALTCGAQMEISWSYNETKAAALNWLELVPVLRVTEETEEAFLSRVSQGKMKRVRVLEPASPALRSAAAHSGTHVIDAPILANGRLELLHFLREVAISVDYHRYGNLGMREGELRKPIL
jgi:RHH-type transcriptional regulator, proline utilization regulon repressor / proline dehydrogenase / delta 1-pyrroline-5-carboxylate dehydrogenase